MFGNFLSWIPSYAASATFMIYTVDASTIFIKVIRCKGNPVVYMHIKKGRNEIPSRPFIEDSVHPCPSPLVFSPCRY